jgi:WS/DGAT C-terminal domain
MFIAPLPVGVPDAAERLNIITKGTAKGKGRPDQGVAGIVALPASLARLGVLWAKRAASAHINLYVTNVPGHRQRCTSPARGSIRQCRSLRLLRQCSSA